MKKITLALGIASLGLILVNCKKDDNGPSVSSSKLVGEWTEQSYEFSDKEYKNGTLIRDELDKQVVVESPDKMILNADSTYKILRSTGTTKYTGTFSYVKAKNVLVLKRSGSSTRDSLKITELTSTRLTTKSTYDDTYKSGSDTYRDLEVETTTYKK